MAPPRAPIPRRAPSDAQRAWLVRGLDQPGGKLPLFDAHGQRFNTKTITSCIASGWAERWFANPTKPDWLVCRLTEAGRDAVRGPKPESTPDPIASRCSCPSE